MMNIDPMSFHTHGEGNSEEPIRNMDISFSIETPEMIIGAVYINSDKSPEDTVVGKIFIYKHTSPYLIEVNFDETYIGYLFDDPPDASYKIANYTLKMLIIDFPGSLLNMSSSNDIGMVQLPKTINK